MAHIKLIDNAQVLANQLIGTWHCLRPWPQYTVLACWLIGTCIVPSHVSSHYDYPVESPTDPAGLTTRSETFEVGDEEGLTTKHL